MQNENDTLKRNKSLIEHLKDTLKLIVICGFSAFLSEELNRMGIAKENILMVFLVGVLLVTSMTRGYIYGAIASIFSALLFNYFFAEPIYSFNVSDASDIILVAFFLIASLISSTMTSKFQIQTEIAKHNERTTRILYEITKGFLDLTGTDNIVQKAIKYIADYTGHQCIVKLNSSDAVSSTPGINSSTTQLKTSSVIPIKGLANQIGVLEILDADKAMEPQDDMLIKTIVFQMALVLDREFIYNEREKIRIAMESEHLKSTLLRSISHDLRSPLTGIIGASELILDSYDNLDAVSIKKLVTDIREESTWLIKSVQNILDMTLLTEGKMTLNKSYEAVDDLVNQAITHVPQLTKANRLHVAKSDDILLINADGRLMVHVLVNLLDNAYKHSGSESQVYLSTCRINDKVVFEIADNGKGIDPSLRDNLFDGFVTIHRDIADGSRGVGLGLAICKAIVTAHNGTIQADDLKDGGAVFKVELPIEEM